MRIALIGCIAVALSFAAGIALRRSSTESDAVAPKVARSLDGDGTVRGVRLLRVDPGTLPEPTEAAAPAPVRANATAGGASRPMPTPAPAVPPPLAPAQQPSPPADTGGSFDTSGDDASSEGNSFDSDG